MKSITTLEVQKIAKVSHIALHEREIEPMTSQLDAVLTYVQRVQEITTEPETVYQKNVNVMREDRVQACQSEQLLAQAPERADNFFVVPSIIEHQ